MVHPSAYARHPRTCMYVPCVLARKILTSGHTNPHMSTKLIDPQALWEKTLSVNLAANMQLLHCQHAEILTQIFLLLLINFHCGFQKKKKKTRERERNVRYDLLLFVFYLFRKTSYISDCLSVQRLHVPGRERRLCQQCHLQVDTH